LVVQEINKIKNNTKKKLIFDLLKDVRPLVVDEECEQLAGEYIAREIFSKKNRDDALHVAVSSVNAIDYLVRELRTSGKSQNTKMGAIN
jgi:hypothetical protein